jgi:6-phosphogluconolactonase
MIGELGGVVIGYTYNDGTLDPFQKAVTLEKGDKRFPGSADLHISSDGKFLYASNRGEVNTIFTYRINKKRGTLTPLRAQSTLGRAPRNFNFDPTEKFLLAANQNSDEIVVFNRNRQTGLLTDSGKRIQVGKPVCIRWIPVK